MLTDVILPHLTGPEIAREVTRLRPDTAVLYMSGYSHDVIARRQVLNASVDYLAKPFKASELARRVRAALDRRPA